MCTESLIQHGLNVNLSWVSKEIFREILGKDSPDLERVTKLLNVEVSLMEELPAQGQEAYIL